MKKVSVIVPCFNVSRYLDTCMKYLIEQTIGFENVEVILLDDASTDNGATWDCILKYEQMYSENVIAIRLEENMRQGGARNVGIQYAGGEYLLFCDADDWLHPEALERIVKIAEEYDTDVVEFRGNTVRKFMEPGEVMEGENSRFFELQSVEDHRWQLIAGMKYFSKGCCFKLFRMELIKSNDIRFAEHRICEEPAFTVPVLCYEKRHYFLDQELEYVLRREGSTTFSYWNEKQRWDNAGVWAELIRDLHERGFLNNYYEEFEYLFATNYLMLTLIMWGQIGYRATAVEMNKLVENTLCLFPNADNNKYLLEIDGEWNRILRKLLLIEINDESTKIVNDIIEERV